MNITYLLGAGASYNALPIVEGIPNALNDFANEFHPGRAEDLGHNLPLQNIVGKYLKSIDSFIIQKEKFEKISSFHKDIEWLKIESFKHTSIDTFAKKLFLQNNFKELKKLKLILSCFIAHIQTKKFDKRYDSFFASVLESLNQLPEKIKILTWNYDSQLEIAYQNFSNLSLDKAKKALNIHSNGDIVYDAYLPNQFCVYKINGTTTVKSGDFKINQIIDNFTIDENSLIESFLSSHSNLNNSSYNPTMSFAWESFDTNKGFFPNLSKSISKTEILIVIGYSFPFFNRKADEFILNSMNNLKKIYVQDPNNSEIIIEKIKGLIPEKVFHQDGYHFPVEYEAKTFADQFFIPIEF